MKPIEKSQLAPGALLRHLLLGWLMAATLEYLLLPQNLKPLTQLQGIAQMSLVRVLLFTLCFGGALTFLSVNYAAFWRAERWMFFGVFGLLSILALSASYTTPFLLLCLLILGILVIYGLFGASAAQKTKNVPRGGALPPVLEKNCPVYAILVGLMALGFVIAVSAWTVGRYKTFSTPTFDFGIFAQMFHNMKETGAPMTTVERDGLLSHFAVHVSPIYYLMLPVYLLFPSPVTLQILQPVILASAVIPLWLIGKRHGMSQLLRTLLCALLLILPVTAGGNYYDLHENCFLLPLLLWLMYAVDRRSTVLTVIFALLTLCVKEDAAVYVAIVGLYVLLRALTDCPRGHKKELWLGIGLLIGALCWFMVVTWYLRTYGDGVMTNRYRNFNYDGSDSLIAVIKATLMCPMKTLFECVDKEKLTYIGQTVLPLMAIPLFTRRFDRYILLIPYILVNLMSDYTYQHNILFQYNFGSTALLVYLVAVNLADLRRKLIPLCALMAAIFVSAGFFFQNVAPQIQYYSTLYGQYTPYYESVADALNTIPDDASVTTHTFYGAYLSERAVLYDLRYCSKEHLLSSDYVVIRSNTEAEVDRFGDFDALCALLEEQGYTLRTQSGTLVIYGK